MLLWDNPSTVEQSWNMIKNQILNQVFSWVRHRSPLLFHHSMSLHAPPYQLYMHVIDKCKHMQKLIWC